MAASKAQETLVAAVSNNCPVAVVAPAQDTADLTRAVSTVVGPPKAPYTGDASALAAKTDATVAKLDSRVADFKERNDDLAGKKIEDTGLFKIPYVFWLGGAVMLVVFVFILFQVGLLALKAYGTANPAVGLGVSAVSAAAHAAASLFSRGFEQVVKGGENFKTEVTQNFAPDVAQKILSLFQTEQIKAQDNDVKTTVSNMTQK
jgi:hypothetical protein